MADLEKTAQVLFKALEEKRVVFVVDSSSHGYTCKFKLYYLSKMTNYPHSLGWMLEKLGFRQSKKHEDLFSYACAGRYSLFTMIAIGNRLRAEGIEVPNDYDKWCQGDHLIVV